MIDACNSRSKMRNNHVEYTRAEINGLAVTDKFAIHFIV